MPIKVKLEYETDLGPHVVPYVDVTKLPRKGTVLDIGGVMLEATQVIKTPFSKYHAAIVCVKTVDFFVR